MSAKAMTNWNVTCYTGSNTIDTVIRNQSRSYSFALTVDGLAGRTTILVDPTSDDPEKYNGAAVLKSILRSKPFDAVIVALGTNDWRKPFNRGAE